MMVKTSGIKFKALLLILICFITIIANANVRIAKIFGSNMVLQQRQENPVWGWANKGEEIVITFGGKTIVTRANEHGKWMAKLPSLDYGGPYEMVIKGSNTILFENIMIGEVWFCSGQSNMDFPVKSAINSKEEIETADFPKIRVFKLSRMVSQTPAEDLEHGEWKVCTPESISEFSAVGYFFGRNLFQNLNVPIGLIHSAWGGSVAESWTSALTIENDPDFKDKLKELAGLDESKCQALKTPAVNPNDYPTLLFNGMVNPVIPLGIQGVIWYQGESNVNFAKQYQRVFPAMIVDWRKHWKQGDFSFLFVSLANHKEPDKQPTESRWAELRVAQTKTLALPKTGMALAIDLGDAYDIHPKNKQDVGRRLALSALKATYGKKLVHVGPMFHKVRFDSTKAVVTFYETGSGLITRNKYGYVNCFAIAGADKKFVWAQARITGKNTVEVFSDSVKNPVAVRFAWSDNPDDFNLYNNESLPANPFRTDDWPGITK